MIETHGAPRPGDRTPILREFGQSSGHRPGWRHYFLAAGLTAATLLLHLAMSRPFEGQPAPIVFVVSIAVSAYLGGLLPGLLATILGLLAADYFLIPPLHSLHIANSVDYIRLLSLAIAGVFMSLVSESLHRARERTVREMMDREHSEEMLTESERRYGSLFSHMLDGFAYCRMIFDDGRRPVDFVYLDVNARFGELTGLRDVIGKRVSEVIPGFREAQPELLERYGRVALSGKSDRFEMYVKPLAIWFSLSVYSPQRDCIAVVFQNITESKKAEQAIRDGEEELRAIYDNVPLIMMLVDSDFRICKTNQFGENVPEMPDTAVGLRACEGLHCLHALADAEDCDLDAHGRECMLRRTVQETMATGRGRQQAEVRGSLVVAGEPREFVFLLSTTRLDVRGTSRVLVTLQDISNRKQAEEQLRQQLQLMSCITEKCTDSIFVTDELRRVTFLNPEAERVFGFAASEILGRDLHDIIHHHHPDGRPYPASECITMKTLETGQPSRNFEEAYFRKDGSIVEVSGSAAVLGNGRRGLVQILRDVTGQKQAMRAKMHSQKLEALGTMAGGIAHDFNNILAAINSNAHLALAELREGQSVEVCLSEIAKAGTRGADLVRRILGFSRSEEQKREVQQLQPVVEEALRLVRATLPAMIETHTDSAADLPPVSIDPSQIHQVIVNLATNAAHAIGDGPGRIEVRLELQDVDSEDDARACKLQVGRYVRLYFSDNGSGMLPAIRERIFDPFFTTKPVGQGTGLGLSIVHSVVASHGGAINVYSEPGRGTAFHIYFPAAEKPAEQPKKPPPQMARAHGERVLLVDDEEALVSIATRKLERLGYTVQGFTDPKTALEEFVRTPEVFDAVISDVSMPHMSGFEFARKLLETRAGIPVAMTSGYVRPEDQRKGEQLGIREFIAKPWMEDELARALERLLRQRTSIKTAAR